MMSILEFVFASCLVMQIGLVAAQNYDRVKTGGLRRGAYIQARRVTAKWGAVAGFTWLLLTLAWTWVAR